MKVVDFNIPFLNLDDLPIKDDKGNIVILAKELGTVMANQTQGDLWKMVGQARKLYKLQPLKLDVSDYKVLHAFIESPSTQLSVLAKEQLLSVMHAASEEPD